MTQPNQTGTCPTCHHSPISLRMIACPMCGSRLPWASSPAPQSAVAPAIISPPVVSHSVISPPVGAPQSVIPEASGPVPHPAETWHYIHNGNRLGPVSSHELSSLIAQGALTIDSSVWRNGMVDWLPARQTELAAYFSASRQPPAVVGAEVNNSVAWLLAFEPIPFYICAMILVSGGLEVFIAAFIAAIPCTVLNSWDERVLRKAGHEVSKNPFVTSFTPAYLFTRAGRLGQNNGYAWVCSVLSLLAFCLFLQNAPVGPKKHYEALILKGYNAELDRTGSTSECSSVTLTKTGENSYDGYITCNGSDQLRASIRPNDNGDVIWQVGN